MAEHAARWEEFDAGVLERYFSEALDFSLGERQLAGMAEFARRVAPDSGFAPDVTVRLLGRHRRWSDPAGEVRPRGKGCTGPSAPPLPPRAAR